MTSEQATNEGHVPDVNVVDHGGAGRSLVLLHGLGGSHAAWTRAGPALARGARVRAVDLPGFGLTPPRTSASVGSSTDALLSLLDEHIGPSVVVGNSMGAVVALTAASRRPDLVQGAVLVNPGLPRNKRVPLDHDVTATFRPVLTVAGPRFVRDRWERIGADGAVAETLRLCTAAPGEVDDETAAAMTRVREMTYATEGSARAYAQAAWSLAWVLGRRRAYYRMMRRIRVPVLHVHGTEDRLVPFESAVEANRRRPDWDLVPLDGIGHLPQVECPERLATVVLDWLAERKDPTASGTLPREGGHRHA